MRFMYYRIYSILNVINIWLGNEPRQQSNMRIINKVKEKRKKYWQLVFTIKNDEKKT